MPGPNVTRSSATGRLWPRSGACRPWPRSFSDTTKRDPERAIRRMIKEANSLGLTVRFDPIEII